MKAQKQEDREVLRTEGPVPEKDEVKAAEERIRKSQGKTSNDSVKAEMKIRSAGPAKKNPEKGE